MSYEYRKSAKTALASQSSHATQLKSRSECDIIVPQKAVIKFDIVLKK